MANVTYRYNDVEWLSTFVIIGLFFAVCGYLIVKHDHHWVTLWITVTNAAMLLWVAYYGTRPDADPYTFKAVKNGLFIGDLIAVGASCWTTQTNKQ